MRIVYNDKQVDFEELSERDKSVTIHHSNIRKLAIEIYKIKNNLSPEILNDVIGVIDSSYNLRSETIFKKRNVHTVRYGTETITFLTPKIWKIVPTECKNSSSVKLNNGLLLTVLVVSVRDTLATFFFYSFMIVLYDFL